MRTFPIPEPGQVDIYINQFYWNTYRAIIGPLAASGAYCWTDADKMADTGARLALERAGVVLT